MQVQLSADLEARFKQLALQSGRATEALVHEALERLVSYDEWVMLEVEKGLSAADRGEFVEHQDVRKLIETRYSA